MTGGRASWSELRPTRAGQRTATAVEFAGLWVGLAVGVPSYYIAGALVEKGMAWYQALGVVVLAKSLLLLPLLLLSHPGARYGLPFPVLARASFGPSPPTSPPSSAPSSPPAGIESWIGAEALLLLLPSSYRVGVSYAVSFVLFIAIQLLLVLKGMRGIRALEKYSAPVLIFLAVTLLIWAYVWAGGFGPMLSLPPRLSPGEFWALFFPSLTANVGSWAAVALTISDFTRFARSQADHILGQLGLPLFMGSFAFVGLAVTSATQTIFGRIISDPVQLAAHINGGPLVRLFVVSGLVLAIVTTNIPANIVGPANILMGLSPKWFTFRRGALVTAVLSVGFQPWRIYGNADRFVYAWLVSYSAVMGPIAGIILTDYFVLRRTVLDVEGLYETGPGGPYYYYRGCNLVALFTMVVTVGPTIPGFLHKVGVVGPIPEALVFIYNVGWFFGFFSSALVYAALSYLCGRCGVGGKAEATATYSPTLTGPLLAE
ncbi:Purine-uracil permease NCS1 [Ananas comosus]|uniref:Purine-uracil permease NCS1 n=1 Tax=Ananas comosus TaxID=4615 RepID=A0A199UFA3_ANACO|nr:Purine-uracil permease NCS1 [Ananas comosus]